MRRVLLAAAAAATLCGCATTENSPAVGAASATAAPTTSSVEKLRPEPKYSLQRPGETFTSFARQSGHFSTPYLVVASESGAIHRFQASTGNYQDLLAQDLPEGVRIAQPQALTSFQKELWVADGSDGSLHQFHGFDPRYVETLRDVRLVSPVLLLHVAGGSSGRLLFVLDRVGDLLKLHRFETRILPATTADQADRIRLGDVSSVELGTIKGIPSLIHDADAGTVVLIHGTESRAWNLAMEEQSSPIKAGTLQTDSVGAGLLACISSLDKGYWFVVECSGSSSIIRFISSASGESRGSAELVGIDWSGGVLFDRSNMALFPRSALFTVEEGKQVRGYAWDEIVGPMGLRSHCF